MNYRIVARLLGLLMLTFGASMLPSLLWSFYYQDGAAAALIEAIGVTILTGGLLFFLGLGAKLEHIYRREAMAIVSFAWILSSLMGALPFYFAHLAEMPTFIDCFFESMSGLTTTGSTVLSDIEAVPKGILFWRSWLHWVGGVGIIMLFVAVLPYLGAGGRVLFLSEATGPVKEGLTPRIRDTTFILLRLYLGYTVLQTILLMTAGLDLFDALCHTFGTLATGGFSTKNASIGAYYDNGAVEIIVLCFMILSAMSFALINGVFRGKFLSIFRDGEWRFFVGVLITSVLFVAGILLATETYDSADRALRDAFFSVTSLVTTTGFVTVDFDQWPNAARSLMVVLMCMGGCAGSTSGGLKMIRCVILLKVLGAVIERVFNPHRVRRLRVGGSAISDELEYSVLGHFGLYGVFFIGSVVLLTLFEVGQLDLVTAFTSIAATINGVGPGLSQVGAVENFAFFSPGSKLLLSVVMLAGRLEFYSLLVLFAPDFWRPK